MNCAKISSISHSSTPLFALLTGELWPSQSYDSDEAIFLWKTKQYPFSFWMTIIINNNKLHLYGLKKKKINNDVIDYRK